MTIIHNAADLAIAAYLGGLSIYDIEHHKVTNKSLLMFIPFVLLKCTLKVFSGGIGDIISMLLGAASGFAILLGAAMLTKGGIGGGDIKLAAVLGLAAELRGSLILLLIASVGSMIYALIFRKRGKRIAFVPFMTVGYLISTLI